MKTAGVICAGGYSEMRPGEPKVITLIDGVPVVRRMIDSMLGVGIKRIAVVVSPRDHDLVVAAAGHHELNGSVVWITQDKRNGNANALSYGITALECEKTDIDTVVVGLGDMGLFSSDTIQSLIDTHNDRITHAVVPLKMHMEIFKGYGLVEYGSPDCSYSFSPSFIRQYWYGNYTPQWCAEFVSPSLYCMDPLWALEQIPELDLHDDRDGGLPSEQYISDLIKVAYMQDRPASEHVIPDDQAWEALAANDLDQLAYIQDKLYSGR